MILILDDGFAGGWAICCSLSACNKGSYPEGHCRVSHAFAFFTSSGLLYELPELCPILDVVAPRFRRIIVSRECYRSGSSSTFELPSFLRGYTYHITLTNESSALRVSRDRASGASLTHFCAPHNPIMRSAHRSNMRSRHTAWDQQLTRNWYTPVPDSSNREETRRGVGNPETHPL